MNELLCAERLTDDSQVGTDKHDDSRKHDDGHSTGRSDSRNSRQACGCLQRQGECATTTNELATQLSANVREHRRKGTRVER